MSLTKASFSLIDGAPANVKDFGAVGDGVHDDRAAIQAAFNASEKVYFPAGTYYVGQLASGGTAIDLRGKGNNISILTQGFVELVCETTNNTETSFFIIKPVDGGSTSHFYCDPIRFRDIGFNANAGRGATAFIIWNGNSNWGNLRFLGIFGQDIYAAIQVANNGNSDPVNNRIRGIFVDEVFVSNGIYGVNLAGQGDGCYFKKINTFAVFRPFFAYNVQGVEANIFARKNRSTSGAVNLGWFTSANGPDLSGLKINYVSRECDTSLNHVLINVIGPSLGTIKGIDLRLDIQDAVTGNAAINFVNYATSGGSPDPTVTANAVTDIIVRGRVNHSSNVITSTANYASAGLITLLSTNIPVDATVYNNFKFVNVKTYAPTWTGSISNPVIGNGTLSGEYSVANGICYLTVEMVAGSTTTFGSGPWSFALPITCRSTLPQQGSALALDAGTLYYTGTSVAAGTTAQVTFDATGSQAQSNIPFTWTTNDVLRLSVSYPI